MRRLVVLYTITVLLNAALLFSVEPMFAKLALPLLGGTPSVWNTALVFFQTALLVGYGYAHITTRWLTLRQQAFAHAGLAALSCLTLPLQLRTTGDPPVGGAAIGWLVLVFTLSLGLPFAVLASGAPLLQRWFAASPHPDAGDPYFLYAASNLGSLCALLGYPFLIEPWFTLADQRTTWSAAYVLVMALVVGCALRVALQRGITPSIAVPNALFQGSSNTASTVPTVTARDRIRWVLYAAVPSSLLMGATTYVSTDVAAMPLLWVVPLSLYLLTFVLAFAKRPPVPHGWMLRIEPYFLILATTQFYLSMKLPGLLFPVAFHFGLLFVVAMVCHGELARRRPPPAVLTEFFLWISVGGLIGGVFNALVAPIVFDDIVEYALVIALAAFLRPRETMSDASTARRARRLDGLVPAVTALVLLASVGLGVMKPDLRYPTGVVLMGVAAIVLLASAGRPVRFGLVLLAVLAVGRMTSRADAGTSVLRRDRSFFGAYRVTQSRGDSLRTLVHGTTVHGTQWLDRTRRLDPLTYYHRAGPMGDLFSTTPAAVAADRRIAVVGLGIGSLACYGRTGERWTYYEIDPLIVEIARDPESFTLLRDCPPKTAVVLGDARLTLQAAADSAYDVLVLDAFSSDAIPVHLLTREAFALYGRVLAPGGVLAVHISNRHIDLESIVSALATDAGLVSRVRRDRLLASDEGRSSGRTASVWVILARRADDLGPLATDSRWEAVRPGVELWTDDFSNVLRVLKWR